MRWRRLVLCLTISVGACATDPTESLLGSWRSADFNMRVTRDSTEVWGGCARGTIPGPLGVSGDGRFAAQFDYVFLGGAPGSNPITTRLVLSGAIAGDRLVVSLDAMGSAPPVIHRLDRGEGQPYLPCPAREGP